jgi:hypothetical protein
MTTSFATYTLDASNLSDAFLLLDRPDLEQRVLDCAGVSNSYNGNCMNRFCWRCRKARQRRLRTRLEPSLDFDQRQSFVTLVWKNALKVEKDDVQAMRQAVRSLVAMPLLARATGIFGCSEVSYHPHWLAPYHVHTHLLVQGKIRPPKGHKPEEALREAWEELGGLPDVDIRYPSTPPNVVNCLEYMVKGIHPDTPAEATARIVRAMDGLQGTFSWRGFRGGRK